MNVKKNTISVTKKTSVKKRWNDITKKWVRKCPECNKDLNYRDKYTLKRAIELNDICRSCSLIGVNTWMLGRHHSEETKKKISMSNKGYEPWNKGKKNPYSQETLQKIRITKLGDKNSSKRPEVRQKISQSLRGKMAGKRNPMYGKRHSRETIQKMKNRTFSDETRRKMRESALGRCTPGFNPRACKIIDEYGKQHGYNFQHALNGGEFRVVGYSVDGYDKEKNAVIEYYEKNRHKRRQQMEKDKQRKQNIINHLGCKFIELKEWEL
jgi:hypothetical protein